MTTDPAAMVDRDGEIRPAADLEKSSRRPYTVVCISIYDEDLDELDAKVAELKSRPGLARANRSWLIRLALKRLELETVTKEDRP
jgi:hypothetical protein